MRRRVRRSSMPEELALAVGLIWGHLNARQFEEAFVLARGCLRVWPDEQHLRLMLAYAKVELLEPLDDDTMALLQKAACRDWTSIVLRRSEIHCDISEYEAE
ncbi:MAG: hypothetical protein ACREX0_04020 [Noviherbaspirillum sp.]